MTPRLAALNLRALLRRLPPDLVKPLPEFDPSEPIRCPACGCMLTLGTSTMRGYSSNGLRSTDLEKRGGAQSRGRGPQCIARVRCSDREKRARQKA